MRKTVLFIIIALQFIASISAISVSKNINDEIQSNGTRYTMEVQYLYLNNNYLGFSFKEAIIKDYWYDKDETETVYYSFVTDKNDITSVKYETGKELPLDGQYILPEHYYKGGKYLITKELKNKIQDNMASFNLFLSNNMLPDYDLIDAEKLPPSAPKAQPPLYKITATISVFNGKFVCTALFVNDEPIEIFLDSFLKN